MVMVNVDLFSKLIVFSNMDMNDQGPILMLFLGSFVPDYDNSPSSSGVKDKVKYSL